MSPECGWTSAGKGWLLVLLSVLLAGALVSGCAGLKDETTAVPARSHRATQPAATSVKAPVTAVTLVPSPTVATIVPVATGTLGLEVTAEENTVKLIVVYDNNVYPGAAAGGLRTDWGFACWVETGSSTVLFDTGGNGAILLNNMQRLDLDAGEIDAVVLSHAHGDHTGGLTALLDTGIRPAVYLLDTFPASFKETVRRRTALVEVRGPAEIAPGVHTTGRVDGEIPEQALAVESEEGLLVITGCAHPGVVNMVRRAREAVAGDVALVIGGYHLGSASQGEIERVGEGLASLGVQRVAPCHCTGDLARTVLTERWGSDGLLPGVGWTFTLADD